MKIKLSKKQWEHIGKIKKTADLNTYKSVIQNFIEEKREEAKEHKILNPEMYALGSIEMAFALLLSAIEETLEYGQTSSHTIVKALGAENIILEIQKLKRNLIELEGEYENKVK